MITIEIWRGKSDIDGHIKIYTKFPSMPTITCYDVPEEQADELENELVETFRKITNRQVRKITNG